MNESIPGNMDGLMRKTLTQKQMCTVFQFNSTLSIRELYSFTIPEVAFSSLFRKKIFLNTHVYYGEIFLWSLPAEVITLLPLRFRPEIYVMIFENIDDDAIGCLHKAFLKRKGNIPRIYTAEKE